MLPLVLGLRRWARVGSCAEFCMNHCWLVGLIVFFLSVSRVVLPLLQLCTTDRAEEGGLPPYVFALMVIYFLQQRKEPLLPTYLKQEVRFFFYFAFGRKI